MRLWKSFRVQRRNEISYYDTMGEFEAERFAVNLNQLIAEAMAEKQKAGVKGGPALLYWNGPFHRRQSGAFGRS